VLSDQSQVHARLGKRRVRCRWGRRSVTGRRRREVGREGGREGGRETGETLLATDSQREAEGLPTGCGRGAPGAEGERGREGETDLR